MSISNIDPAEWKKLEGQAATGQLTLHPDIGNNLARVCDDHIDALEKIFDQIYTVERLSGFGNFPSSRILENKFSLTAAGGDRSLDETIRKHIEAVTTAKEVVLKAIANFEAQDDYNSAQITGAGGN
ncbi:hypothetical protein ACIA5E_19620 [Nocardia asteroides]|uniref:hypothetical protein n=1 Tax=Nocardia asteroides TaxID=1824 RepID=UPI0037B75696